jgi:hypothetical protein
LGLSTRNDGRRQELPMSSAYTAVRVVITIAVLAVAAACSSTQDSPGTAAAPSVTTPSAATASASPSVLASSAPPIPPSVPDNAFLQSADTHGGTFVAVGREDMLPALCGPAFPSDAQLGVRRTVSMRFWTKAAHEGEIPAGTLEETLAVYKGDGAARFVAELRAAVTGCPTSKQGADTYRHTLLPAAPRGDESLLIEVRYPARDLPGDLTGGEETRLVSTVRPGDTDNLL